MILTAATWNLLGGGIDNGSDARLRRQLTLLAGLNLDVAAFQECKHWADDDSALLHMAEEQLGMTGFLAESAHHRCHLAVFVRESAGLQVIDPRHERRRGAQPGQPERQDRHRRCPAHGDGDR